MPKRIQIEVSEAQRATLERWSKQPPAPYVGDRARAILRVAGGEAVSKVAPTLRTPVHRNAVGEWVRRFVAEGVAGLRIRKGRGRKPLFSPSAVNGGPGRA
jgi:hypothetical protein